MIFSVNISALSVLCLPFTFICVSEAALVYGVRNFSPLNQFSPHHLLRAHILSRGLWCVLFSIPGTLTSKCISTHTYCLLNTSGPWSICMFCKQYSMSWASAKAEWPARRCRDLSWIPKWSRHPLEEELATHSGYFTLKSRRQREPDGLLSSWHHKELDATEHKHRDYSVLLRCVVEPEWGSLPLFFLKVSSIADFGFIFPCTFLICFFIPQNICWSVCWNRLEFLD